MKKSTKDFFRNNKKETNMHKAPIYSVRISKPSIKAILQVNGKRLDEALEGFKKNGYEVLSVKEIVKGSKTN